MKDSTCAVLLAIGLAAGCSQPKDDGSPTGELVVKTLPAVDQSPTAVSATPAPPYEQSAGSAPAAPASTFTATNTSGISTASRLDGMNNALRDYVKANDGEPPQSLHDLVKSGYLSRIPPAPPGMRFKLDREARAVVLTNTDP